MPSGYQVPILYGRNEKAPLKLRESANTNFLLARDNQMERQWVHPRNYPGCPPFQERTERRKQPSSGEVTRALLLTYLLWRLAPTLVAAFCKAPTPDFRYLERRSNHSATVAGAHASNRAFKRVRVMCCVGRLILLAQTHTNHTPSWLEGKTKNNKYNIYFSSDNTFLSHNILAGCWMWQRREWGTVAAVGQCWWPQLLVGAWFSFT
jgi:hypothetical protein